MGNRKANILMRMCVRASESEREWLLKVCKMPEQFMCTKANKISSWCMRQIEYFNTTATATTTR